MYISELVFHAIENLHKKEFNTGRTNIQKLIFFSIKDKEELLQYYEPYHYGPFSEDVQISIQAIVEKKIIKYTEQGYVFSDDYSFETAIKLTKNNDSEYVNNIRKEVDFLYNNDIKSVKKIATLAKIYYYYVTSGKADKEELKKYIEASAPHTWPTLTACKSEFSKYIDYAEELHKELA